MSDPLEPFIDRQGYLVLDGGLATELEARGHDLDDELWSAKLLLEDPAAIGAVHRSFLEAGADCIATATYQASFAGFRARGVGHEEAVGLFRLAVDLAAESRDEFWADPANRADRLEPLVAASLGPYGAFLADGSEYRGDYGLSAAALREFHETRWRVVLDSRADLTAFETIPSALEAEVLADLLTGTGEAHAWLSFSCRDDERISDGTPLSEIAGALDGIGNLVAIGINCTAPELIAPLTARLRRVTTKPVFAYPNAGGRWDAKRKVWETPPARIDWEPAIGEWRARGAFGLGGCCRVRPDEVAIIRRTLDRLAARPNPDRTA